MTDRLATIAGLKALAADRRRLARLWSQPGGYRHWAKVHAFGVDVPEPVASVLARAGVAAEHAAADHLDAVAARLERRPRPSPAKPGERP